MSTPSQSLYAGTAAGSQAAARTLDAQCSAQPERPAGHGGICDRMRRERA